MLTNLLRTARVMSIRAQIWWLGYMMESQMAENPITPKRRRRKITQPEVLNADVQAAELNDPDGVGMTESTVRFFASDPLMSSRRRHLGPHDVSHLIAESLQRHGMPADVLAKTRWLWVGGKNGCPELYLILPGIEA